MTEGIYLKDRYEIENEIYEVDDMKIEHIDSSKDFIVGIYFKNIKSNGNDFWESAKMFLGSPHKKV